MKRLLSILILALLVNIGIAQENTIWVDSVLTKVILHEIEVFDKNFKPIKSSAIKLLSRDTVINCQWSRPKYLNNILQSSFDGILIESQIVFDTSTNKKNRAYIDFKYSQYDANRNFLKDRVCRIPKKKKISRNPKDSGNNHNKYEEEILEDYGKNRRGTDMESRYKKMKKS